MQPTAVIRHPNHPERFVEIKKLDRSAEYDLDVARVALSYPMAVVDPTTGEYIRLDKDGNPDPKGEVLTTMMRRPPPLKMLCAEMQVRLVRWGGIVDEAGGVIEMNTANIPHLYQRWNDVTIEDGVWSFARYIEKQLDNPELFDKDPSGNS